MTIAGHIGHYAENNLEHFRDVPDRHLDTGVYRFTQCFMGWMGNPRLSTILKKKLRRKFMIQRND